MGQNPPSLTQSNLIVSKMKSIVITSTFNDYFLFKLMTPTVLFFPIIIYYFCFFHNSDSYIIIRFYCTTSNITTMFLFLRTNNPIGSSFRRCKQINIDKTYYAAYVPPIWCYNTLDGSVGGFYEVNSSVWATVQTVRNANVLLTFEE